MTELCEIGFKYKTDKCPQIKHHFTEWYYHEFNGRRNDVRKVVEIGIGNMHPYFVRGASLYMWREYFPNAMIYGADIDPQLLFTDQRIDTVYCDQTNPDDLIHLLDVTGSDVDLFIDDGLHTPDSQIFTCLTVMPMLDRRATYVIEDAGNRSYLPQLREFYDCTVWRRSRTKYNDDRLVIVRRIE